MSQQLNIRLNPDLKATAGELARREGKSLSGLVRELLDDYVRRRDLPAYVDGLWDRMGERMRRAGFGPEDVDQAIAQARGKRQHHK